MTSHIGLRFLCVSYQFGKKEFTHFSTYTDICGYLLLDEDGEIYFS